MAFPVSRFLRPALAACVLLLAGTGVLAHHGVTTKFDPDTQKTLQGRIARVDWAFPHAHLFLLVNEDGAEESWYIELESPQLLELNGWNETTLNIGETVSVTGPRARDGSRQVWGSEVRSAAGDTVLTTTRYPDLLSSLPDAGSEPTPRWPDGKPRLGAPPGNSGYWIPEVNTIQEDGMTVAMAANGQLENIDDAARVAPLQDWALALYQFRQRDFLRSDPTYVECRPPAGPRKFMNPYGIQLLEDKPLDRIFVIAGGGNHDWHLIYTDGRDLDSEDFGLDAGNLLYYGRNTAQWEGDSLVIESEGYNEKFWLPGGLPHSEMMHATERLTRTDYDHMTYEITIDDPATYTRPWSASWTLRWMEGQDPREHYCQDNRL